MASFQKRGKTWQYTISRMVNGKYKPIRKGGFRTKKEAQIEANELERRLKGSGNLNLEPFIFSDYFEEWLDIFKPNISERSRKRYISTLNVLKKHFGKTLIQDISKREYQRFLNEYGKTRTKRTVNILNKHVRACVRNAVDEGLIMNDFTKNIVLSGKDGLDKNQKYINYTDSKKLLKEIYKNLDSNLSYYVLLLALTTGLRFGEIVGLTKEDFDFEKNTININKTWAYYRRNGGFTKTKNKQSIRTIKVDKNTMRCFKELFEKTPPNPYNLIFYTPNVRSKVLNNDYVNRLLKKVTKRLNIQTITVHGLRHTHASILLYKGISIHYISERLGHKDIQTTINNYTHLIRELETEEENKTLNIFENML